MSVLALSTYNYDYDWNQTSPYPVAEFFSILDALVNDSFYGFSHPLGQRLLAGKFSHEELKFLAKQEYFYYWGTTWWNAFKLGNATTLSQQRRLSDALIDELGTNLIKSDGLPAHSDLFLNYCHGLGITLNEIRESPIVTGVVLAITELLRIAKERPSFEFIACSNLVVEKMRPIFYSKLLQAFHENYNWIPKDALIFYEIHATLDVSHASLGKKIVTEYIKDNKREQDAVFSAILRSIALRKVMYDSIDAALNNPTSEIGIIPWPNFPHEPWPRPTYIEE